LFHWYVVGHIDPLDPVDTSGIPHRPKVVRPLCRDAAEQVESEFGRDIDEYVAFEEPGFVVCNWSFAPRALSGRVSEFAFLLAELLGAVVMDERYFVFWPPEARAPNRILWSQRNKEGAAPSTGCT
jgi:hypothetical protein